MAFNKDKTLKEAEKLLAKGKHRDAIRLFEEVYKNDPRDLNALNKVGDLYLQVGDKAAAIDAYARIADKYASDGFNLRAIAMYKKCQRVDPTRIEFVEKLAEMNAQQGLTNEAKLNFQQVADHYTREGKGDKARQIYARIAEIEPDNLKNRLKLADMYLKENKLQQALGEYRVIGAELAKKGMLDESIQVLEKALGLDGSNVEILRAIARTRVDMGRAEEGVRFIHGKLAEKGNNDPSLLLVLGETLQAAGHHAQAREAFERAQQVAPERADVPIAFYRLCLEQGDADGALAQYLRVAGGLLSGGMGEQVVEDLKAILRLRDGHVPTLERLVQVQVQLAADMRTQGDWMSRLAEGYITHGRYNEAEGVLGRLVEMEPDVAQHGEKLEFVRMKAGGGAASAPPPAAAAPPSAPAPAPAETSFSGFGDAADGSSFAMSFDDDAMEAEASGDDRGEFVSERSAEADVFIKYGLVDKAIEQLQTVLGRYPDDVATRQRLVQICRDEGRKDEELAQLVALAGLFQHQGDAGAAREALVAAQVIAPGHPAVVAALGAPPSAGMATAPAAAAAAPAATFSAGFELSLDDEPAAPTSLSWDDAPAPAAAAPVASAPAGSASGGEFELSLDGSDDELTTEAAGGGFDIASASASSDADAFELSMDEPEAAAPAAAEAADEFEISVDADEGSADAGFGGAAAEPAALASPEAAPLTAPVPAAAPIPAAAPVPASTEADEGLFGEEDDFFNFADEINKELEAQEGLTEVTRADDRGMSLEEIISGIQKGVAEQVDEGDYETHYNLGIAYKEMGLADEAIGEFQYASRDASRYLACCILLGACFTEKGMPELAVQWYEKGKAAQGLTEEDRIALDYEIALCRQALGEDEAALKSFMSIYATNARYRDVSQQIARLKQTTGR